MFHCRLFLFLSAIFAFGHVAAIVGDDEDWWYMSRMLRRLVDSRGVEEDDRHRSVFADKRTATGRPNVDAEKFLSQFGYLQKLPDGVGHDPASRTAAIRKFQKFYGLLETGELDAATTQAMLHPRCGVPDTQPAVYSVPSDDVKRYIPGTRKWHKTDLTYFFKNFATTRNIDVATQKSEIKRATQVWSDVTPLTFVEVPQHGDINIEYGSRIHSDGPANQFDGPGMVLAHAYYPESGEFHVDDEENWNVNKDTDLFTVAAHELGHALGLPHSNDPEALMAPWYNFRPDFTLPQDDIDAIQYLYGPNPNPGAPKNPPKPPKPSPTTTTTTTTPRPVVTLRNGEANTCNVAFRAVAQIHDNSVMVFGGSWLWRLYVDDGLDDAYPVPSKTVYPRAPDNVDAAVYSRTKYFTYLFYGRNVWVYHGYNYLEGHVVATRDFAGSVNDVIVDKDGKIYLIKGAKCWQFDEDTLSVLPRPPNCSTLFPNLPANFNSTVRLVQQPNHIFLFSGPNYYKYNDVTHAVEPGYPKAKAGPWLGRACGGTAGNQ